MEKLLHRIIDRLYAAKTDEERRALYAFVEKLRGLRSEIDEAALGRLADELAAIGL